MSRFANYRRSPALQAALDAIARQVPATHHRCRKDAARALLRGEPSLYVDGGPDRLRDRYLRFVTHVLTTGGVL